MFTADVRVQVPPRPPKPDSNFGMMRTAIDVRFPFAFQRRTLEDEKGCDAMDTHARLQQLLRERGWTEYKLSKECGLAQSTIGNIFRRNTVPSVATLETICKGFGITMSQFFADTDMVELSPDMKELFDCWVCLTPSQKSAAIQMLKAMSHDNE